MIVVPTQPIRPPGIPLSLVFSAAGLLLVCGCAGRVAPEPSPSADPPVGHAADPGPPAPPPPSHAAPIDGGTTPAPPPLALADFPAAMTAAICGKYEACCPTVRGGPPGTFRSEKCAAIFHDGFEGALVGFDASTPGRYVFDAAKARICVDELAGFECASNPAASYKAATEACVGAVVGTGVVGDACVAPIDCAPGHWCDAATGQCAALAPEGGACAFQTYGNEQCAYKGDGPGCDADLGTCSALLADGEVCYPAGGGSSSACKSGFYSPTTLRCAASGPIVYPAGTYPPGLPPAVGTTYAAACADMVE